jgi:hypothetical protein
MLSLTSMVAASVMVFLSPWEALCLPLLG